MAWYDAGSATCIAAYDAISAASQAASLTNLANPGTYDLVETDAPTWAAGTGWTFAGADRLSTGITPATGYSIIARILGSYSNNGRIFDANAGGNLFLILPRVDGVGQRQYSAGGSGVLGIAGNLTSGAYVLGFAGTTAYKDGSAETGSIPGGTMPAATIYIGNRSAGDRALGGSIAALAIYSGTVSGADMATITTAMNALPVTAGKGLPVIAHWHADVFGGGW